ncbi:ER membrane protein complex subunit 3-like [Rhynchophorus ferrugineus]|uniref:ER membrane protein complex subunit 3-like n=1 Tax=Rhynchophorus ferrugineus TaxID=354439 RepID=UPI003FCD4A31
MIHLRDRCQCVNDILKKMLRDFPLDTQIRSWVFLPISLLTCLIECLAYYTMILVRNHQKLNLHEIQVVHMRNRLITFEINHLYLSKQAINIRKRTLKEQLESSLNEYSRNIQLNNKQSVIPEYGDQYLNTFKEYSSKDLPMIMAGTWVSYMFSGFICTKIPFPLTSSFKAMLQRSIELNNLEPSWVSSCSWYFLNVFGIKKLIKLLFNEEIVKSQWVYSETFDQEVIASLKEYNTKLDMIL